MKNPRWLHVGSGPHAHSEWVNLDLNSIPEWEVQPDILASVFDMPFGDDSMDKVYLGHVAEHLEFFEEVPRALREIKRVLAPFGVLCVVGPCLEKAVQTKQPTWLLEEVTRGWDTHDLTGFPHLWSATTLLTRVALETTFDSCKIHEVPITDITLPEWPNTAPASPPMIGMWQCAFLVEVT